MLIKPTKEELKKLSEKLFFEFDDKKIDKIIEQIEVFISCLSKFDAVPTADILPTDYPFIKKDIVLRDDEVAENENNTQQILAGTVGTNESNYVVLKK
ncbi:MAG: hypothetical protein LBC44_04315 [Mycoplasmataceae bacterium]|jgi:Asp-tRNA(Asn)/Glu-tRNA(Gln) amidotransferase C subunit|nr:hypothetical protein [Mycoplasmataceae bacterium]